MFKTTQELQDFLLWCTKHGIERFKVADIEVQFSNIALLDTYSKQSETLEGQPTPSAQKSETAEDEELLFWSSQA